MMKHPARPDPMAPCPHCGAADAGEGNFCTRCGQPLRAAPGPGVAAAEEPSSGRTVILLHLAVLLVLLLVFSYRGAGGQHRLVDHWGRPAFYTATILWEWLLLGYVWVGMRRQKWTVKEITGGRWSSAEDVLIDLAIAAGFWIVAALVLGAVGWALGLAGHEQQAETLKKVGFLAPANWQEILLWLGLSATAGFCEEIIFRGYLQRQFINLTRSSAAGIVLSAAVFGASHGYEGAPRMVQIGVFGLMFGLLAHYRRSLRPGMIAHAWHDSFSGIVLHVLQRIMKP